MENYQEIIIWYNICETYEYCSLIGIYCMEITYIQTLKNVNSV